MSKLLSGLEFRNTYVSTKFYSVYYILFFFGGGGLQVFGVFWWFFFWGGGWSFYNRNLFKKRYVLVLEFPFFTFVNVVICASFYSI